MMIINPQNLNKEKILINQMCPALTELNQNIESPNYLYLIQSTMIFFYHLLLMFYFILFIILQTTTPRLCNQKNIFYPSSTIMNSISMYNTQLQQSFSQYITNNNTSNLTDYIKSVSAYFIPLLLITIITMIAISYIIFAKKIYKPDAESKYNDQNIIVILGTTLMLGLGLLILGILLIIGADATSKALINAQCNLQNQIDYFLNGENNSWVGINNVPTQISNLILQLSNNLNILNQQISSFTSNTSQLGIYFNLSGGVNQIVTAFQISVASILYSNTANTNVQFPICQSSPILVNDPVNNSQMVQLNYVNSFCIKMVAQMNQLQQNARSLDLLFYNVKNNSNNLTNITSQLNSFSSTYNSLLNSTDYNKAKTNLETTIGNLINTIYFTGTIILVVSILILSNVISRSEKIKVLFYYLYIILAIISFILTILSSYFLLNSANIYTFLMMFNNSKQNQTQFNTIATNLNLFNQLNPIYSCINNPSQKFLMNSTNMIQSYVQLNSIYQILNYYLASIPINTTASVANTLIDQLTGNLSDFSALQISSGKNLSDILTQLDQIGNWNISNSIQATYGKITQDTFVFNELDCPSISLINPLTEFSTTSPRCIQIPTTNNINTTNLNTLTNIYQSNNLSTPCNNISNIFNSSLNCFLQKRSNLFTNDTLKNLYITNIQNLVNFSSQAGDYTDTYIINLQNYLSALNVFNTNVTSYFLTPNLLSVINQFAGYAENLTINTNCSYIVNSVNNIDDSYSSLSILLFQQYILGFVSLGIIFVISIFLWQTDKRLQQLYIQKPVNESSINNNIFSAQNISKGKLQPLALGNVTVEDQTGHKNQIFQSEIVEEYMNVIRIRNQQEKPIQTSFANENKFKFIQQDQNQNTAKQNKQNKIENKIQNKIEKSNSLNKITQKELNSNQLMDNQNAIEFNQIQLKPQPPKQNAQLTKLTQIQRLANNSKLNNQQQNLQLKKLHRQIEQEINLQQIPEMKVDLKQQTQLKPNIDNLMHSEELKKPHLMKHVSSQVQHQQNKNQNQEKSIAQSKIISPKQQHLNVVYKLQSETYDETANQVEKNKNKNKVNIIKEQNSDNLVVRKNIESIIMSRSHINFERKQKNSKIVKKTDKSTVLNKLRIVNSKFRTSIEDSDDLNQKRQQSEQF